MTIGMDRLKRRTSYREFITRWLADENGDIPARFLNRLEEREAKVAAKMHPGDELWEFERCDRPFGMTWGLAVVRAGEVIEWWVEFKS